MMKKLLLVVSILFTSLLLISCNDDKGKVEKFIVSFNTNGGSLIEPIEVVKGNKVSKPAEPTKDDYTFNNWYSDEALATIFLFDQVLIENDITIYAKWDKDDIPSIKEEYTVLVDNKEYIVKKGEKLPALTHTELKGKIFLGFTNEGTIFDLNTPIIGDLVLVSSYRDAEEYQVIIHNGKINGESEFSFYENERFILNDPVSNNNTTDIFEGWFTDSQFKNKYTKTDYLTDDLVLYAYFVSEPVNDEGLETGTFKESIWANYNFNEEVSKVQYRVTNEDEWFDVDDELIRKASFGTRIDIVGLKAGFYDVKVTNTNNEEHISTNNRVLAHDRSGYGHFKYDEGIGAYKDDGTLKDDAIVVYVTDSNKDKITIDGIGQTGIGWIMNNAQYSSNDKPSYDINKYNVSLAKFDKPIVFRLIGTVTSPDGATIYDSLENGGSKGDNGHMVRMRDAKNITIEGIGEDAVIEGWGMHFMAASKDRGIGFEVRNITFDKYPEDAVGMEGVQSGNTLTFPVQRGWIHNNTFLPGYAKNPAESDKAAGDGSLDIKRGLYFTISYNQFLENKKTNLVGASDSNMQYHITYHHNHWKNVDSRVPLARQGNIHMYNNLFETTDDNQGQNSYVQNTRANAYIFSENNYFNATKAPSRVDSGAIKSFGDIKYSTYDKDGAVRAKTRDEKVVSGNKYEHFDTDPSVFYYDAVNKKSDVTHLTDAITARVEAYAFSGVNRANSKVDNKLAEVTKDQATLITESKDYGSAKINKGTAFLVFEIEVQALVEMVSTNKVPAVLVDIYGREFIRGTGSASLEPGIYIVESSISHGASKGSSQAKDSGIDSLSIKLDEQTSEERIQNVKDLINLIPATIKYDNNHKQLIDNAAIAYDRLSAEEKALVNNNIILDALLSYNELGVEYVSTLISNIGVVTTDSGDAIRLARNAYNLATNDIKGLVLNYSVLIDAEQAFEGFEVESIISEINDLEDLSVLGVVSESRIIELLEEYQALYDYYLTLDDSKQELVTNIDKLVDGVQLLEEINSTFEMADFINDFIVESMDYSDLSTIKQLIRDFDLLSSTSKEYVSSQTKDKYELIKQKYLELDSEIVKELYYWENNNNFFNVTGKSGKLPEQTEVDGKLLTLGLKLESSTVFNFNIDKPARIIIQLTNASSGVKINGEEFKVNEEFVVEAELTSGTINISRIGTKDVIVYLKVILG